MCKVEKLLEQCASFLHQGIYKVFSILQLYLLFKKKERRFWKILDTLTLTLTYTQKMGSRNLGPFGVLEE